MIQQSQLNQNLTLNGWDFLNQFESFKQAVLLNSGSAFESFGRGLPYEWEQYKDVVYHEGRQQLAHESWREKDIGTGKILKALINAIQIRFPKRPGQKYAIENNLVDWDSRYGPKQNSHRSLAETLESSKGLDSYESLLFRFYRDELSAAEAFEQIVKRAGKRYDFLAYIFFLKDWTEYLPIAPTHFDRAFKMLNVDLRTTHRCSWANYQEYISVIRQVRDLLREANVDDARLIDAHSFCWMLQHPNFPKPSFEITIPVPDSMTIVAALPLKPKGVPANGKTKKTDWKKVRETQELLGKIAEGIVLKSEKARLTLAGRGDLASLVHPVSDDHSLGYDIVSFNEDGSRRFIEAKAARQEREAISFFVTENELQRSRELSSYFFYLVFDVRSTSPLVRFFPASQLTSESLTPVVQIARVVEA